MGAIGSTGVAYQDRIEADLSGSDCLQLPETSVFIGTVIILFVVNNRSVFAPAPAASSSQPEQRMTLEPAIIDNLTAFPDAPRLTGELADQVTLLQTRMDACSDYGSARRSRGYARGR